MTEKADTDKIGVAPKEKTPTNPPSKETDKQDTKEAEKKDSKKEVTKESETKASEKNDSKEADKRDSLSGVVKTSSLIGRTIKKNWGIALTSVKIKETRKQTMEEPDPFLDRFTVTGRAYSEEYDHEPFTCEDIFTSKFWKTMVVDPSGSNYYHWSSIVMVAVLYNVLVTILRCVFYQTHSDLLNPIWISLDYTADFFYLWDMWVKSRIGFLEQGLLVRDVKRLTMRYIQSWRFFIDIVSLLPIDLLYLKYGFSAVFRLNRCLRIWRLMEFFQMAETHTNFPNLMRVGNLLLYIVMIIHWNACFYFAISRAIGFGTDGWVYPDITNPKYSGFWGQFLYSLYWSTLTLTTIGDTDWPEQPVELIVCILDSLSGVLIFATIFGNVGAMINNMNADRTEFQHKVDQVKAYMELRGIGEELQSRVIKYFDYTWNNKLSVDDKACLSFLPDKLRAEISIHVHMKTLRRVAIFQDCEPGLLVELVLKLVLQVYSPGDYICRKGDIGKEMYIVKRGRLQVVSEDGKKVFVTLTDGTVFGEVSVLNISGNKTGNRRTASVKSVGYSDLFCLSKNDLWAALEEYPEAKKMLMEKGKQILRKDKLLDEEMARREERRQQAMVTKIENILDTVDDINQNVNKLNNNFEQHLQTKQTKSKTLLSVAPSSKTGLPPVEDPEKTGLFKRKSITTSIKEESEDSK